MSFSCRLNWLLSTLVRSVSIVTALKFTSNTMKMTEITIPLTSLLIYLMKALHSRDKLSRCSTRIIFRTLFKICKSLEEFNQSKMLRSHLCLSPSTYRITHSKLSWTWKKLLISHSVWIWIWRIAQVGWLWERMLKVINTSSTLTISSASQINSLITLEFISRRLTLTAIISSDLLMMSISSTKLIKMFSRKS